MTKIPSPDKPRSFLNRCILPVGIILGLAILSWIIYSSSVRIDSPKIHWVIAYLSGLMLFLTLGFGTFFIYPFMYFKEASPTERILGSLVTFIVWTCKELIRVSEYFTVGETLYYGLSSIFILILLGTFGQMGVCELICRKIAKKRGAESIKVITPLPVIAIVTALVALYVLLVWGVGVHWFYIYMEGYKAVFGS